MDAALLAQYGRLGGVHGQAAKQGNNDPGNEEILDHDLQTVNDSSYRPYVEFHLQFDTERA